MRQAKPGPFASINYAVSDLWSAATIGVSLRSGHDHTGDTTVSTLLRSALSARPRDRPRPRLVATVLHLLLWSPSHWHQQGGGMVSNQDILQWLLTMATKVICECRWDFIHKLKFINLYI